MSEDELVSVVVPIYKVEKYLAACVDSILRQSYRNLQVILVDDGSPDGCPTTCDRYEEQDPRVEVIHKKNGGLSDARNAGMEIARGEWIAFVDSDDWLDRDYVRVLMDAVHDGKADVGIGDYRRGNHPHEKESHAAEHELNSMSGLSGETSENGSAGESAGAESNGKAGSVYSNTGALQTIYASAEHGMTFTTWGKLYRRSLWADHNIRFPVGKIHEDAFTTYQVLYYASAVIYVDEPLYYYRVTEGSIMQKPFSLARLDGLEAAEETWNFFLEHQEQELAALAGNYYCRLYFRLYSELRRSGLYDAGKMETFHREMKGKIGNCLDRCRIPGWKKAVYRLAADHPAEGILRKVMAE